MILICTCVCTMAKSVFFFHLNDFDYSIRVFFGIKRRVELDRNPEPGYHTLLLRLIPGDLLSACPHSSTCYATFKVRGPFVQTLCIEKDSYMDAS